MERLTPDQLSRRLIECLAKLESEEQRFDAKLQLSRLHNVLIPSGTPDYLLTVKFKTIGQQIEIYGKQTILKSLFLLIKDFAGTFNVVRNMTDDQMVDCALLLTENYKHTNYRIEDFVQFFQVAKTGRYGKVFDRIDAPMILELLDRFDDERWKAGNEKLNGIFDEVDENLKGFNQRIPQSEESRAILTLAGGLSGVVNTLKDNQNNIDNQK